MRQLVLLCQVLVRDFIARRRVDASMVRRLLWASVLRDEVQHGAKRLVGSRCRALFRGGLV